jgi:cysteine-S-conjugate beta-lyase
LEPHKITASSSDNYLGPWSPSPFLSKCLTIRVMAAASGTGKGELKYLSTRDLERPETVGSLKHNGVVSVFCHIFAPDLLPEEEKRAAKVGSKQATEGNDYEPLLPAWVADMDFPLAECVREALMQRFSPSPALPLSYQIHPPGFLPKVENWLTRRHGANFNRTIQDQEEEGQEKDDAVRERSRPAPWIVDAPSSVGGLAACIRAYSAPGDRVMVLTPCYYPFFEMIELNDRVLADVPLAYQRVERVAAAVVGNSERWQEGKYSVDWEAVEACVSDPLITLFLLCNPHNPVGLVFPPADLRRLIGLCREHGVFVVSDEVWADLVLPRAQLDSDVDDSNNISTTDHSDSGARHLSVLALETELMANTATIFGFSKAFNLAGVHQSFLIVPSPSRRRAVRRALNATGHFGPTNVGMLAFGAVMDGGEPWLNELTGHVARNVHAVRDFFRRESPRAPGTHQQDVVVVCPDAQYTVWVDWSVWMERRQCSDDELLRLLVVRARIALDPGSAFGSAGKGFQRINVGCSEATVAELLRRIRRVLVLPAGTPVADLLRQKDSLSEDTTAVLLAGHNPEDCEIPHDVPN